MQIKEQVYRQIARGDLSPGDRLPSVREAAIHFSVNPNTVQRAFQELEREGVTETRRGQGSFVVEDPTLVERLRSRLAEESVRRCVEEMAYLQIDAEQATQIFGEAYRKFLVERKESLRDPGTNMGTGN